MIALVWNGSDARVTERAEPSVGAGMALVRVDLAGVCNTDLELGKGYMHFRGVLGHEFVGTVAEGPAPWVGKRVVGEINFACGSCDWCRRDLGRHCPRRTVMGILDADGAFAEMVAVPVANLHEVPAEVPDDVAVFAEPLAAAFEVLEQVQVERGREAVVLGDGKLGLLVAQVLHDAGARVLAVGKHADKLAVLRNRGIPNVSLDEWDHTAADLVVEATGTPGGFELAVGATRPRGTLVLTSTIAETARLNLAPLVVNEISVVGSRCGPFAPALAALAADRVDVRSLISERFPLRRAAEALRRAAQPGVLKVLIETTRSGGASRKAEGTVTP
jgi:threonine dehydrogenase-like Zn-dependent dehydrogenase